jgi:hypothetical protein
MNPYTVSDKKPADKAGKPSTKQSTTGSKIPWGMIAASVALLTLLYFGLPMLKKTAPTAPVATEVVAPVTTTETVKDGIRESLKLEFGTVHRTVEMKAPPVVTWEKSAIDPNLRFPIDQSGDLILGVSSSAPPVVIDSEPGYRWVKIDDVQKAPARWKGAVTDTGRVWGIVPAAL